MARRARSFKREEGNGYCTVRPRFEADDGIFGKGCIACAVRPTSGRAAPVSGSTHRREREKVRDLNTPPPGGHHRCREDVLQCRGGP